jgi:Domain of unknown function (DUF4296)
MRLIIIILFSIAISCSCSNKKKEVKIPDDIMPKDSMVIVIKEVHLVEAAIFMQQQQGLNQDKRLVKQYYNHLFTSLDVDLNYFKKSLKFYSFNPIEMEKIYTEVVNQLSMLESEVGTYLE